MKKFETWLEGQIKDAKTFRESHIDSQSLNMDVIVGSIRTLERILQVYRDMETRG